jgi:hypothetical protein
MRPCEALSSHPRPHQQRPRSSHPLRGAARRGSAPPSPLLDYVLRSSSLPYRSPPPHNRASGPVRPVSSRLLFVLLIERSIMPHPEQPEPPGTRAPPPLLHPDFPPQKRPPGPGKPRKMNMKEVSSRSLHTSVPCRQTAAEKRCSIAGNVLCRPPSPSRREHGRQHRVDPPSTHCSRASELACR